MRMIFFIKIIRFLVCLLIVTNYYYIAFALSQDPDNPKDLSKLAYVVRGDFDKTKGRDEFRLQTEFDVRKDAKKRQQIYRATVINETGAIPATIMGEVDVAGQKGDPQIYTYKYYPSRKTHSKMDQSLILLRPAKVEDIQTYSPQPSKVTAKSLFEKWLHENEIELQHKGGLTFKLSDLNSDHVTLNYKISPIAPQQKKKVDISTCTVRELGLYLVMTCGSSAFISKNEKVMTVLWGSNDVALEYTMKIDGIPHVLFSTGWGEGDRRTYFLVAEKDGKWIESPIIDFREQPTM